uniref:Uncharacterized protein n=1 Tax=Anguilla anguilla TaxID=7936 RepID=A0A0E9XJM9_ANGAN
MNKPDTKATDFLISCTTVNI